MMVVEIGSASTETSDETTREEIGEGYFSCC